MVTPKGDNMAAHSNVGTASTSSRLCVDTSVPPLTWRSSPKRRQRIFSGCQERQGHGWQGHVANYPRNSLEAHDRVEDIQVRDHCPSRRTADERPSDPWLARGSCAEVPFRTLGGAWLQAVYSAVPVRTCTWGEAYQSCEQIILEREKQCHQADVLALSPSSRG